MISRQSNYIPTGEFQWGRFSGKITGVNIPLPLLVTLLFFSIGLAILSLWLVWLLRKEYWSGREKIAAGQEKVKDASKRLDAILRISHKFVQAEDEKELVEWILRVTVDLLGARGASFVPVDERGRPITAYTHGELPIPVMKAWVEYLASPAVRQQCLTCENYGLLSNPCPLLKGPFSDVVGLYCLELRRGQTDYGVLNLYIPDASHLTDENRAFMQSLVDATALALEAIRLRRREMETIRQLQGMRHKPDIVSSLESVLESLLKTMDADTAIMFLLEEKGNLTRLARGKASEAEQQWFEGAANSVIASREPVLVREASIGEETTLAPRSLVCAPLTGPGQPSLGAILVSSRRPRAFHNRQLTLLQTVAGQAALLVQNSRQLSTLEYRLLMDERSRLAREIHDGLAQTLGFLKLQAAQLQNYAERSDWERVRRLAPSTYEVLSEAYQDVREALDGLRIQPGDEGLRGWLDQTVLEFEENTRLPIELTTSGPCPSLPPEVHAQLIRIVQEALSNIRKHAQASHVSIACGQNGGALVIEIYDNGCGFSPMDVPLGSRYGLRGMKERAELICADFRVSSQVGEGTTIRLTLPLQAEEVLQ